ncbi:MAG: hypothetical protein ABFD08_09475, partial [Syntrophomonas sp.]
FWRDAFYKAQEQEIIPLDELFDMSSILSNGSTIAWPYNLYVDINNEIYQLDKDKNISHFNLSICEAKGRSFCFLLYYLI